MKQSITLTALLVAALQGFELARKVEYDTTKVDRKLSSMTYYNLLITSIRSLKSASEIQERKPIVV